MTIIELNKIISGHDRHGEFLADLAAHRYPNPDSPKARTFDVNDQFEYFWRRVADGEDLQQSDYLD